MVTLIPLIKNRINKAMATGGDMRGLRLGPRNLQCGKTDNITEGGQKESHVKGSAARSFNPLALAVARPHHLIYYLLPVGFSSW